MSAGIRGVLEAGYLRALLHGTGRRPESMSAEERAAALAPLLPALDHDERAIRALVAQAKASTHSALRKALHGAPGVDHEMLDQALEYALQPRGGWKPQ